MVFLYIIVSTYPSMTSKHPGWPRPSTCPSELPPAGPASRRWILCGSWWCRPLSRKGSFRARFCTAPGNGTNTILYEFWRTITSTITMKLSITQTGGIQLTVSSSKRYLCPCRVDPEARYFGWSCCHSDGRWIWLWPSSSCGPSRVELRSTTVRWSFSPICENGNALLGRKNSFERNIAE